MTLFSLCCEYMFTGSTHIVLAASVDKRFAFQQHILIHGGEIDKLSQPQRPLQCIFPLIDAATLGKFTELITSLIRKICLLDQGEVHPLSLQPESPGIQQRGVSANESTDPTEL